TLANFLITSKELCGSFLFKSHNCLVFKDQLVRRRFGEFYYLTTSSSDVSRTFFQCVLRHPFQATYI
ncbi:hypothetical protein, partial [Desulfitispora alkaliphila]|uniref:hypothetical protein n=1 Tax=Desulfitispora alkaliphila TaxID=622674 RepID=UPI003D1CD735